MGSTLKPMNCGGGCRETANVPLMQDAPVDAVGGEPLVSVTIEEPGSGYAEAPTLAFSGGAGTGAASTATLNAGAVSAVTVTAPGKCYTTAPTATPSGGTPEEPTSLTAVLRAARVSPLDADGFIRPPNSSVRMHLVPRGGTATVYVWRDTGVVGGNYVCAQDDEEIFPCAGMGDAGYVFPYLFYIAVASTCDIWFDCMAPEV